MSQRLLASSRRSTTRTYSTKPVALSLSFSASAAAFLSLSLSLSLSRAVVSFVSESCAGAAADQRRWLRGAGTC